MQNWAEKYYLHGADNYISRLQATSANEKAAVIAPTGRVLNHADDADAISGDAGDFIDSWLTAITAVSVYDAPGGSVKAIFQPGEIIGKIGSFVVKNGYVWWLIDDPTGKHYGYVRHVPGTTKPSGGWAEQDKEMQENIDRIKEENDIFAPVKKLGSGIGDLVGGVGNTLGGLGDSLKWIVFILIAGLIIYTALYAKKTLSM